MILRKKEEKNWEFDFSIYEKEEKQERRLINVKTIKRSPITSRVSKFSSSILELDSLQNLKTQISMKAIKVAAYTQNIQDLWDMYGCLNEFWARIHDIFGYLAINEVKGWQRVIEKNLLVAEKRDRIPFTVHRSMLRFRDVIYVYAQRINLGLQVNKKYGSQGSAKLSITQ